MESQQRRRPAQGRALDHLSRQDQNRIISFDRLTTAAADQPSHDFIYFRSEPK
jgi:hypothetical protein